ncbi:Crossover junction endonuclease mus81 [Perkinsus chesapeaki]|uniref:Crossover junction endonuclease mus81 n=1 Tax=Perkinsus chesapeaki TaxID=330153 RepID=A0A7J6M3U1_PERCH|nr:Crossover junction endonuclease mus81 [Perkinsus chesapeaki]
MIYELQRQLEDEKEKCRQLEEQFRYRLGAFVQRESASKKTIEALEDQLHGLGPGGAAEDEFRARMAVLRRERKPKSKNMHDSLVAGIECIQGNTAKVLQDQEKDLMRAFRARMQDVSKELEHQKAQRGNFSAELQARLRQVLTELRASQDLAQAFDKKNRELEGDNKKLVESLEAREDDRQSLLKELVTTRREVGRLRDILTQREESSGPSTRRQPTHGGGVSAASSGCDARGDGYPCDDYYDESSQKGASAGRQGFSAEAGMSNRAYERELRYRRTIEQLRAQVSSDRLALRTLRETQNRLLKQRSEIEVFLQQCIDDVKNEIAIYKKEEKLSRGKDGMAEGRGPAPLVHAEMVKSIADNIDTVNDLSAADRERALELLLCQERVIQLLHQKVVEGRGSSHHRTEHSAQSSSSSSFVPAASSGGLPSQTRLTDPDLPPRTYCGSSLIVLIDAPPGGVLRACASEEYETTEGVYGDYQTEEISDEEKLALVKVEQQLTQTLHEALLVLFGYANELFQNPFDFEEMDEKEIPRMETAPPPPDCADPESRLIRSLPRTANDCKKTLHTEIDQAVNLCRTALDGITIDGDFRIYVNYGIRRAVAIGSAISTSSDRQSIRMRPIAWAFDMRLFKVPDATEAVDHIVYLRLLKASEYPGTFEKLETTASLFGSIMEDPTPRDTPSWSMYPIFDLFDPHKGVLRLAFADADGNSAGLAESFAELPSAAHEGINKLFGAHEPVLVRAVGSSVGIGSGRASDKAYESAMEMDVATIDDGHVASAKMLLMVYGHDTGVVDMNFFLQKKGCSRRVTTEQLTDQMAPAESTTSLIAKNILTPPVIITSAVLLVVTAIVIACRLRQPSRPPIKTIPENFIESVVEPLVLEYVATVLSQPQKPRQYPMPITTGWQAEQLDGVGSTFAQVFAQVIAEKEASASPRRSSLTWRKTIKNRAEKFLRDAPTVSTDVTEGSEDASAEQPRRKQREYRPATGDVGGVVYRGSTEYQLGIILDSSVDKEYRLTDTGLSLGQRILASVEFPLAALGSIRCTATGTESSDTRRRRRLSYTGAPVPEKDLDEFRYAGTQPLPNPVQDPLPAVIPSGPWEPVLVVDVRESSLIKELTSLGVHVESRSLPITDFLWLMKRPSDGRELIMGIGGERKTWQDLSASIIDGRYDEQKYRLASKATALNRIFYVIEGDVERSHGGMRTLPSATLRSALCNNNSTTYDAFGSSCAKTVGITVRDLTGAMVRQVPGCGAEATKALLEITEKRMGNVTAKNVSELLKTTGDATIMQAAKTESSTNRSPITQKVPCWSRELAVRELLPDENLKDLLLCSGPDLAIRDVLDGRVVKLKSSLSHPDAIDPREQFPPTGHHSPSQQQFVHFTVSRAGMDLESVFTVLAGHRSASLHWGAVHNPHRSALCTQRVSLPIREWSQHILPRWRIIKSTIDSKTNIHTLCSDDWSESSTSSGGTFDIGDVSVDNRPVVASRCNGYRYDLTLRPAAWEEDPKPCEDNSAVEGRHFDLEDIKHAGEAGFFPAPAKPEKPPIVGRRGIRQTSFKELPFVVRTNYFDLHSLDYPRCRDHTIGLAALTGNYHQAISLLFTPSSAKTEDASRAFDAFSRGDYIVCAALLPERFHLATEIVQNLVAGASWKEAFLSCAADRRFIATGLCWIWNGLASRRISHSSLVAPGDIVLPFESEAPIVVKDTRDAEQFTLADVVIPLNLLDEGDLPAAIDGGIIQPLKARLVRSRGIGGIPLDRFRRLSSHASSVYIDPVDGGAVKVSFTLRTGSYADSAMREVCGDQLLLKSDEEPKKVEVNAARMFSEICFL